MGLLWGTLDLDLAETFDTIAQPDIICNLSEHTSIEPEDLALPAPIVLDSRYVVVRKDSKSSPIPASVGIPEGRTLSSACFAAAAKGLGATHIHSYVGLGLSPPLEAITAFLANPGTNDRTIPDISLCTHLFQQRSLGRVCWAQAMRSLLHTSDKLCLLDISSSVKVGISMYLDDTKAKASSWGALHGVANHLSNAVRRIRGEIKLGFGKTSFRAQGFHSTVMIPCGSGHAHWTDSHVSLGVPLDTDLRMRGLLLQIEGRGHAAIQQSLVAFSQLGLSLSALLRSVRLRVRPKACHGAMFLLLRADWATRLDRLQDHWLRRTLGLGPPIARSVLLWELGFQTRLSTSILAQAISLLARADFLQEHHPLTEVLRVAREHASTWTRTVESEMKNRGIPRILDWRTPGRSATKQQRRAIRQNYMHQVVWPVLCQQESAWFDAQPQLTAHRERIPTSIVEMDLDTWPLQAVQAWAQLRLQAHFSCPESPLASPTSCRICKQAVKPCLWHFMTECPPCRHACQSHMGLWNASDADEAASLLNSADEEIGIGFCLQVWRLWRRPN